MDDWIKIEDGCEMPGEFEPCYAYGAQGPVFDGEGLVHSAFYTGGNFHTNDAFPERIEATYWLPVPAPPEDQC
jgi:hypothetical protein